MRILIACEFSGVIRDTFTKYGHDAYSCDILEGEGFFTDRHIQGDVLEILDQGWDMMIAHPPCTYLANSGVRWLYPQEPDTGLWVQTGTHEMTWDKKGPDYDRLKTRWENMWKAREFFLKLWNAPIERICVENPVPHYYAELPKYTQTIQPYQFGHPVSKRTCLWLKNLPKLVPTEIVKPDIQTFKSGRKMDRWYANLPHAIRAKERSKTFEGIAYAMGDQWLES